MVPDTVGFAGPGAVPVQLVPTRVVALVSTRVAIVTRSCCYTWWMDRICEQCGDAFVARAVEVAKGKGRFCSTSCFDLSRRVFKEVGIKHRMTRANGHPIAPPSGIAPIARLRLYERIGPGEHPCHWCGELIEWAVGAGVRNPRALLVDHVDHDATNDEPTNLVPSCNRCNSHRRASGTHGIIRADELTVMRSGKPVRASQRVCEYCGEQFLAAAAQVRIGKGRFCSRSCARRAPSV